MRIQRRACAFLIPLLLALAGCSSLFPEPPPPDPATEAPALEGRIFELINDERHTEGKGAKDLVLDSELVQVARARSNDMAAKNSFVTDPADPHISATRLMAIDAKYQGLLGENLASETYAKAQAIDVEGVAKAIVGSWVKSESHRQNLAYAAYARTGVGVAFSANTIFVTELFATDPLPKPVTVSSPLTHQTVTGR